MEYFADVTRAWFRETFAAPTPVQELGWRRIAAGDHALLLAPTGSGKTLAAFLWAIDRVAHHEADASAGVRVLYVSPLKALVYDVERNLRAPLVGIQRAAEKLDLPARPIRVDVRTGDTPQSDRQRQRRNPAEILVTTPESLFLLLGSSSRETLKTVHTVIVDEVHALAPTKRGVHLAVSLERLAELTDSDPQRIGLSATVRPVDEVAAFLGGDRTVEVVDAARRPALDLSVVVPVPDMEQAQLADPVREEQQGGPILGELAREQPAPSERRLGIWPAIHPELVRLIREHRSTIVFTNSRGLCERLAGKINELADEELVLAHHGSVSHEQRRDIEERLKAGTLQGIVATSSLELGIDMGAVDLVILIESPGSVARGLQRVGRAGHQVDETSRGVVFPKFRGDLLECAVVSRRMRTGELEALRVPRNALDVLAQQVVAMVCDRSRTVAEIEKVVRRSLPYRSLTRPALIAVLDMLSGRYPSDEFADLRPRIVWDRTRDVLSPRRGSQMLSRLNAGTIPDRGQYTVHLGSDGPRLGELDEEMVYESRGGDVILLGATSWRILEITRDRVIVEPAAGEPGRLPFWRGDGLGRPVELGRALGEFLRELDPLSREQAEAFLREQTPLDGYAARNLAAYVTDQKEHTGVLPTDRAITVERFRDELGDWRVCILTPFGARLHAPWSLALQSALSARSGFEVVTMYGDDGIVLTLADRDELPDVDQLFPDPDELESLITDQLTGSALFGAGFRENAARALLLPRRRPGSRSPLWAQRLKAKQLLGTVLRYPDFPIVLETYRQCLQDVFDLPGLIELLRAVRSREVRVDLVETRSASPFARSLVFAYVAAYLYEYDAPLAERRAQALSLDRNLLRELLGETELRALLDAEVLEQLENDLQHLSEERRARDGDELHDVLRRLGALTAEEVARRCREPAAGWLQQLEAQRRAVRIRLAGIESWIAAQDAGTYRDALGAQPPPGLPDAFLEADRRPLERLLRRYARTHGPFPTVALAQALGLRPAQVEPILEQLQRDGALVRGELRPGGTGREWCDEEVLRRLKRQTLAKLRGEVSPVESAALGRFLPAWQGVGETRRCGTTRLEEVIRQLEGCPLPWSALSLDILPSRVPDYSAEMLDVLCATGRVVWVGRAALGSGDGRVQLLRRETAALVLEEPEPLAEPSALHTAILEVLRTRGASFSTALRQAVKGADPAAPAAEFEAALWDLVWAGLVTNDTFAPLRTLGRSLGSRRRRRERVLAGGRWSLVSELIEPDVRPTERLHARAEMLLERHGVVSREMVQAEEAPGGFGPLYRVLQVMEESGRVRRGHFVEGLSGAQFALPGAVDRLREVREAASERAVLTLPATDPANPWGAVLAWPGRDRDEEVRARRVPGATVVLVDGRPALWVSASRRRLVSFPDLSDPEALGLAIELLPTLRGRTLVIEKIDGAPVEDSAHRELFERHGFVRDYRGWILHEGASRAGG